jgi:dihydrofolate reductase
MRKINASTFISLDGVMQAPGGPEEDPTEKFKFGGWTVPYWDDASGAIMGEIFSKPYELLLGRKTYDIFAAYWPQHNDNPIGEQFNAVTKYVATSAPDTLTWHNSKPLGSDVVASLRELKKQDGPDLLIQGSSVLAHSLLASDLIDKLTLLVYPVILGHGKRLFDDAALPSSFRLASSKTSSTGVVMSTYERAGDVKTGTFE